MPDMIYMRQFYIDLVHRYSQLVESEMKLIHKCLSLPSSRYVPCLLAKQVNSLWSLDNDLRNNLP